MYSPKIDEELIPRLYRLRKLKKIPMTRLVNGILEKALSEMEDEEKRNGNSQANPGERDSEAKPAHDMNRGITLCG